MRSNPNDRRHRNGALGALALAAAAFVSAAAPLASAQDFDWDNARDNTKITIYLLSSSTRKEFDFALTLLAQGRYADALPRLRPFVSRYANRCIPVQIAGDGAVRVTKESNLWMGIGRFLRQHMDAQPADVRAELERFDGPAAKAQLSSALEARDAAACLRIAREYPWTRAGAEALVAAAAMALERGDLVEALALYRRAAARPVLANDPNIQAPAVLLARVLAPRREMQAPVESNPNETGSKEKAEVGGKLVSVGQLSTEALPNIPDAAPSGAFTFTDRPAPADPGPISGGIRWSDKLEWEPDPSEPRAIEPVIAGDSVYVTNGWSITAYELATGRRKKTWTEPGHARNMDTVSERERRTFVASEDKSIPLGPAVGGGVVVVPLVVPLKLYEDFDYNAYSAISVRKVHAFRKLHAFDAKTGALLWDHFRPDTAKQQNDFIDKYRCSSSPVIVGERVICPVYMFPDDASPEFHVAAFSLRTGELLWDTNVVTGSRPINMFGRSLHEFYSCPPSVDGDRIFVSTDLGAIACIEATTGQIDWLHRYESIPLPQSSYQGEVRRELVWTASPPVFNDDVVIFSPVDSRQLIAVDKETGERVASVDSNDSDVFATRSYVRHLVGIAGGLLYVSGEQVFALDIPSKSSPAFRRRAVSGSYRTPQSSTRPPRPVLTDRTILVPRPTQGISVLDLRDLRQTHLIPYDAKNVDNYPGNLAVADGIVVSLGNPNISWFFDTEAMVESARRALLENPKDSLAKDRLADCLRLRGMNQIEAKDYGAALESLRESEELFASLGPREAIVAKLALAMAEAHAARGEAKDAIAQLRRAFDLARDPDTRLRAGINLERELPRSAAADRAKLLEAIDKEFGRVRIGSEIGEIPVGLYLCIRRAETALPAVDGAADGHPNDPAAAVAAWQEILVRFPDELLGPGNPTLASAYARTRITDAIRRFGRGCYAAAEQSAARQLALLGADPSPDDLGALIKTYPNSQAAMNGACVRLEQLAKRGKAAEVPLATHEYLESDPAPEMRKRVLRAESEAIRMLGNEELANALADRVAGHRPAAAVGPAGPAGPAATSTLNVETYAERQELIDFLKPASNDGSADDMVFAVDRTKLYALRSMSGAAAQRLWNAEMPREVVSSATGVRADVRFPTIAIAKGIVACGQGDFLMGYRVEDAGPVYTCPLDGDIETATASGGVFVATIRAQMGGGVGIRAVSFDMVSGAPLWNADLDPHGAPYLVVASPAETVFLGIGGAADHPNYRIDTATGEVLAALQPPADLDLTLADMGSRFLEAERKAKERSQSGAAGRMDPSRLLREFGERFAIYGDRLVFYARNTTDIGKPKVVALDLANGGSKSWELAVSQDFQIRSVLFCDGEVVVFRQNIADNRNTKNISDLVSLDPRTGDTRVLVTIPAAGRQIDLPGAAPDSAVSWRVPVVVTLTSSDSGSGNSTRIDCVDLKSRRTWMRSIPVKMYLTQPTAPAAGNEVVALAYTFVAGGHPSPGASASATPSEVRLFRRDNGEHASDRAFPLEARPVALATTKSSIFALSGTNQRDVRLRRFFNESKEAPK